MLTKVHTGLESVPGVWWRPAHKSEKIWVSIAFAWCMVLFAMMPLWHWKGGQNPSGIRTRVNPQAFYMRTVAFANQYKVGDDRGLPIVQPPPGADVYLVGLTFQWYPILKLQQAREVRLAGAARLLALSAQREFRGSAELRLRAACDADSGGRFPDHMQRVLRHRPPHNGRARHRHGPGRKGSR